MQAALVLVVSAILTFTAAPPSKTPAWDKVQQIAKASGHRLTVNHYNDNYFIELSDSDLEGAGPTIEDAAEDFLGDMNMHTEDHGADTKQPDNWKPPVVPPLIKPETKDWI
jgi:hypothetical protein